MKRLILVSLVLFSGAVMAQADKESVTVGSLHGEWGSRFCRNRT